MADLDPDRVCRFCNQNDDHPRHIPDLADLGAAHHDCCAEHGCDSCKRVLAWVPDGAQHGLDLKTFLSDAPPRDWFTPDGEDVEDETDAPKKTAARKTAAKKESA